MAEHAHTTSPRRRALLAGTGMAAAVTLLTRGAPSRAAHPDAELVRLHVTYRDLARVVSRVVV